MPAFEVQELTRDYAEVKAVRGISLAVEPGELYGLVGPDGAGKTTAISCLAGIMQPTSGSVRILGQDPLARGSKARHELGLMPQEYSLYGDLSVAENLWFFGQLFALKRSAYEQRVQRLLGITRLQRFTERRAAALSGGMYKKLALCCALLHEPKVLLLDEPTNGVDPVSRRELWDLIYEFVAGGMAVLISTPYMDEAARCHRVGLMHKGRIIASGSPGELTRSLEHDVCEVQGGDREALHDVLAALPEVVAASPAGAQLRIVITPGKRADVERTVAQHGASLRNVAANFEDLFLARIAGSTEQAA